jgi:hypothetical protein
VSEIKITVSRVSVSKNDSEPVVTSTKSGWIRSPIADRMTAWHLRDLVRALDAQDVPATAKVVAYRNDVGHTTHLTVEWSEALDGEA